MGLEGGSGQVVEAEKEDHVRGTTWHDLSACLGASSRCAALRAAIFEGREHLGVPSDSEMLMVHLVWQPPGPALSPISSANAPGRGQDWGQRAFHGPPHPCHACYTVCLHLASACCNAIDVDLPIRHPDPIADTQDRASRQEHGHGLKERGS